MRRRLNRWAGALTCSLVVVAVGVGSASAERLALVSPDPELEHATVTALAPWGVDVLVVNDRVLGPGMPRALDLAAALARSRAAGAVVWIASAPGEPTTLWLYDAASARAMALRLPGGPPFDPPTAAGVALTVKTLLRYSQVAPIAERYALPPPPPHRLGLEASTGVELRPSPAARWEPRFGVTAIYRPFRGRDLALALGVGAGPGFALERPDVVGRYRDTAVSLALRVRLALGHRLWLRPAAGLSLHVDSLSVTVPAGQASAGTSASADQLNPAASASLALDLDVLSHVRVAVVLAGDVRLRRQRFLVGSQEVYDIPAFGGQVGLGLEVPFL